MHIKSLSAFAALAAVSSAVSSITSLDAAQSSRILSAWSVYDATVGNDKSVFSLVNAVATAVPSTDVATATTKTSSLDLVSYLNNPPKESIPTWLSDLPTSLASPYAALITSVESQLVRIGREAATGKVAETHVTTGSTSLASSESSLLVGATGSTASESSASAASASSTAGAALATSNAFVMVAGMAVGAVGAAAFML